MKNSNQMLIEYDLDLEYKNMSWLKVKNNLLYWIFYQYRKFRHIGSVYTIIDAFCQEYQARVTSPNGFKPLQADKWLRLQRGATKSVFMTLHPSFVLRAFSCNSQSFPGDFTVSGIWRAHGTNLCVPWCCTSRFCMSWRGGVKQKLGGLPN